MNILVTGGAGYIGSSLVEQLNALPEVEQIYVLDNLSRSPLAFFIGTEHLAKVSFIKADILDAYALDAIIQKVEIVYHLAAYVSAPYHFAQNVQYEQVNKWGTLNLVRCIMERRPSRLKKVVYLSSASVYGLKGNVKRGEAPQPTNAYGKSKLAGEAFIQLLATDYTVHIIRAGNVFGFNTNFRVDSVLNHFIFHALVDGKILIYGDGRQQRPFVSLPRVLAVLIDSIVHDGATQGISHAIDFNAALNELKDWLQQTHLPQLEYTYVNPNIIYDGQFIDGIPLLAQMQHQVDGAFVRFKQHLRIIGQK